MALVFSARNQLQAKVKFVKLGTVMAEIVVESADGQEIFLDTVKRTLVQYKHSRSLSI